MLDIFTSPSIPGWPIDAAPTCLNFLQQSVHGEIAWAHLIASGDALQELVESIAPTGEAVLFLGQALFRIGVMTSLDPSHNGAADAYFGIT